MPLKRTRAPPKPKPASSSPNNKNNRKNVNFVLGNNAATSSNNNNNFTVPSNSNNNNGTALQPAKKPRVAQSTPPAVPVQAAARPQAASRGRGQPKNKLEALQGPQTQPMKKKIPPKQMKEIVRTLTPAQASHVLNACKKGEINGCHNLLSPEQQIAFFQNRLAAKKGVGIRKIQQIIHDAVLNATADAMREGAASEVAKNPLLSHGQPISPPTQQQAADAGEALRNAQTLTENTDPRNPAFRSAIDHAIPPLLNYLKGLGIFAGGSPIVLMTDLVKVPAHMKFISTLVFPLFQQFSRGNVNASAMTLIAATPYVMAGYGNGLWGSIGIILGVALSNELYHLKESKNAWKGITNAWSDGGDWSKLFFKYFGVIFARFVIAMGIGLNPLARTFQAGLIAAKSVANTTKAGAGTLDAGAKVGTAIFDLMTNFLGHLGTHAIPALSSGSVAIWEGAKTAGRRVRAAGPQVQRWGMYQKIAYPARAYWSGIHVVGVGRMRKLSFLAQVWAIRIKYFILEPNRYTAMSLIMILLSIVTYLNKAHVKRVAQGWRATIGAKIGAYRARRKNARNAILAKAQANRLAKANANRRSRN